MKKTPRVSIGMPVYNGERFIREAIDSLLAQTFTDFELIISDNASTDKTGEICQEYAKKDHRVRYIRQTQNIGAIANYKFVLNEAVGEFFMWAAADDIWHPRWIEELLLNKSDIDYSVRGLVRVIDANGRTMDVVTPSSFSKKNWKYFVYYPNSGGVFYIYGLFRTKQLKSKFDGFDLGPWGSAWGDSVFIYSCLWEGNFRCIPSVWQAYRIHDSNLSSHKKSLLLYFKRLIFNYSPTYYLQFIRSTPIKYKTQVAIFVFFRYAYDQYFYYRSIFQKIISVIAKTRRAKRQVSDDYAA